MDRKTQSKRKRKTCNDLCVIYKYVQKNLFKIQIVIKTSYHLGTYTISCLNGAWQFFVEE